MKPMITAHSGCSGTPANSMEYIEKACQLPIAALELDIRCRFGGHGQEEIGCRQSGRGRGEA